MEDFSSDRIEQLLVAAASIMEDMSAILLDTGQPLGVRIALARDAGAQITSLSVAAAELLAM